MRQPIRLPIFLSASLAFVLVSCSSSQEHEAAKTEELQEEVRLKEDRTQFDELRKQVPEDVKIENDELAFTLNMTAEGKKSPSEVWSKFNDAIRRRREIFDKQERKVREDYNKNEKKHREDFLAEQKKTREEFYSDKPKPDEKSRFSNDQDSKRREFFDDERDKRKDLESDLRQKRSDFEAYLREKRSNFDNEMKVYSKTYYEKKRTDAAVERAKAKKEYEAKQKQQEPQAAAPADPDLKEFESIPKKGTPLQPTSEE